MRKKFTMLLASLLVCMGAWAQPETGKMYRIKDNTRSKYLTIRSYNGTSNGAYGTVPVLEKSEANNDQVWYLEDAGNSTYYLKSKSEYYLVCRSWCVDALNTGGKSAISLEVSNEAYYLKNGSSYFKVEDISSDSGTAHPFCDAPSGHANIVTWTFEEVDEAEFASAITMRYEFVYGGDVKYTQETTVVAGNEYPNITTSFPYGVTATKPEGTVNAEDAVDGVVTKQIELSVGELPFVAAETAEGITNWYYIQMHWNNKKYVNADGTSIVWSATELPGNGKNAYTWGFVGNIWDGFQVVNYAAYIEENNENTTLTWNSGASLSSTGTVFAMVHSGWNGASAESFCLQIPNSTNYLNAQGSSIASWSAADAGSTITLTERPMGPTAELEALVEEIEAMGIASGENIGDYTVASVTALNEAVAAAKAVETATAEDVAALQAAVDGLAINLPEVGKFYAIKSASTNAYCKDKYVHSVPSPITRVDATWGSNAYDHRHLVFDEMVSIDATALWQFTEDMKMRNVHTGEYVKSFNKNVEHMGAEATASSITIKPLGSSQVSLQIGSNRPMHAQQAYFAIVDWDAELNNASAWYIEEVTEFAHPLTIDEYDYMTLTLGFNAEVPEGVTAYKVTGTEGKELVLESVGTVIPAGEPVIVYAEVAEGQTKDVEFAYTAAEATKSNDNLLKGTLYESNVAPTEGYDAYVMALNGSEVVMGKAMLNVNENTQFKNRANKAYLEIEQEVAAGAPMFSFGRGEGTTGIDNAQLTIDNVIIYDLAGRRVEKMEKGIYIVNGKKVIR